MPDGLFVVLILLTYVDLLRLSKLILSLSAWPVVVHRNVFSFHISSLEIFVYVYEKNQIFLVSVSVKFFQHHHFEPSHLGGGSSSFS
jgi:hypothetical protein